MKRLKAAFVTSDPERIDAVYTQEQKERLASLCDLMPGTYSADDIRSGRTAEAEVFFSTWAIPVLTEEDLEKVPRLKAVFYAAGATDHFARPYFAKGVHVISAWRMNAIPVAEFCHAQIILALKGYFRNSMHIRQTRSWANASPLVGPGAYGETVALIGAGAISTLLKEKLEQHDLNVIVVPSRPERRTVSILEAFSKAFVISNHLPNRTDNIRCIGRAEFEAMRPGAVFINTGRGAQIDEEAMIDVFRKRQDLTALLDVTSPEPPGPESALYDLPNVRMSSHIAGSLNDETHRMADCVIAEFERFLEGKPFLYEVTENMLLTAK